MKEYTRGDNPGDQRIYNFLREIARPIAVKRFNYRFDDLQHIKRPFLLLSNHNMDVDPVLVGVAAHQQLYFVASEHITHKKLLYRLLDRLMHPIIHVKGRLGVQSTMEILRTLRRGGCVGLFPEGNRSSDGVTGKIPEATAKLARSSGASLVTFRIEGGYLAQPRWSIHPRKGRLKGKLVRVYSPEELKQMSAGEVYDAICRDLHEDAVATQQREAVAFRGKAPALGMEATLFTCPHCQSIGTLHSDESGIFCGCGFRAEYDEYGLLHGSDGSEYNIRDWNSWQRGLLRQRIEAAAADERLFADRIELLRYNDRHQIIERRSAELAGHPQGLELDGKLLTAAEIGGLAYYSRNVLVLHPTQGTEHFELRGSDPASFNALKYVYLYETVTGTEQL